MSIINKNDILKVLISYNPWWKTNEVGKVHCREIVFGFNRINVKLLRGMYV